MKTMKLIGETSGIKMKTNMANGQTQGAVGVHNFSLSTFFYSVLFEQTKTWAPHKKQHFQIEKMSHWRQSLTFIQTCASCAKLFDGLAVTLKDTHRYYNIYTFFVSPIARF